MSYEPKDVLDCSGMSCPMPILKTKKAINQLAAGDILKMIATDPGSKPDMEAWCKKTGNKLLDYEQDGETHIFYIEKS